MSSAFVFDNEPHSIAPRLLTMHPAGTDVHGETESLGSYLARLAHRHRLTIRVFIDAYINRDKGDRAVTFGWSWLASDAKELAGVNPKPASMADWIERNSGAVGLRRCSLTYLSRFLCGQKLVTKEARICRACLEEDQRRGGPVFERLLWRLEAVRVCDRHACRLVPACACDGTPIRAHRRKISGGCRECHVRQHEHGPTHENDNRLEAEIWVTQQCRNLIALLPKLAEADPAHMKAQLRAFLMENSNIRAGATVGDIDSASFATWISNPTARCTLSRLMDIALAHRLDVAELVQGRIQPSDAPAGQKALTPRRTYRKVDHTDLRLQMQAAIGSGISVSALSRQLNVAICSLHRHKDLYEQLVTQSIRHKKQRETLRRTALVGEVEDIIVRLLSKQKPLSLRNASIEAGVTWPPTSPRGQAFKNMLLLLGRVSRSAQIGSYSNELKTLMSLSAARIQQRLDTAA